jgi:hypothetical protein
MKKLNTNQMSEWKNKIKRQTIESEDFFCAGTG